MTNKILEALRKTRVDSWDSHREYESARWAEEHDGCSVDWDLLEEVSNRIDAYQEVLRHQRAHQKVFAQWAAHRLMEKRGGLKAVARLYLIWVEQDDEWDVQKFAVLYKKCRKLVGEKRPTDRRGFTPAELEELELAAGDLGYEVNLAPDEKGEEFPLGGGFVSIHKGRRY